MLNLFFFFFLYNIFLIRETVHESVARACKEQQRQIEVFLKKRVLVYLAIGFPSGQDSFTTEKCLAQFI